MCASRGYLVGSPFPISPISMADIFSLQGPLDETAGRVDENGEGHLSDRGGTTLLTTMGCREVLAMVQERHTGDGGA